MHLGIYERSLDYLLAAQEIDQHLGNTVFLSQNMNNLGEAFRNQGLISSNNANRYKALDYFTEALDSAKRNGEEKAELRALNNIGNIHLDLENYGTALNYLRSALVLSSGENEKAQALRLAKLSLLKSKYSHPFYWAAFVLHGESSSALDFD